MMFELFKYLLWLCMPYTIVLILLFTVAIWLLWRKLFKMGVALFLITTFLVVGSLPVVPTALGYSLEKRHPPLALKDIPKADAVVVLGGGIGAQREGLPYPECYPASDRVIMAARLFHTGKAGIVVPTGEMSAVAEKPLLEVMQVPAKAILCEEDARDTAENATKTMDLLRKHKCKKVLVVTSSWHLPRAMMLFQAPDIEFVPVGCDYEATLSRIEASKTPMWMKLPSPAAMAQTGIYLKEYLGILFYAFRKPRK